MTTIATDTLIINPTAQSRPMTKTMNCPSSPEPNKGRSKLILWGDFGW